jgi:drug/metabolite transporter (DMT)-like permease
MTARPNIAREFALLALLALWWGASYPLIKIAVAEIPPITLIATRVSVAALALLSVTFFQKATLPRDWRTWKCCSFKRC